MHTEWGQIRCGPSIWLCYHSFFPLARLDVDEAGLRVRNWMIKSEFAKADIIRIDRVRGVVDRGFQLMHANGNAPSCIVFWSYSPGQLTETLRALGYDVSAEESFVYLKRWKMKQNSLK